MGDKIEIQNRFGAWQPHLYECLVDVRREKAASIRRRSRRSMRSSMERRCITHARLIRDLFIVTDRRILNVDKQGLTGSRKNYDSIAYNKIGRRVWRGAGVG